jgi:hypothetical protein
MNLFLHSASFILLSLSIRSEKELSVVTYIIQKGFLWRGGQGFHFLLRGQGRAG